MNLISIVTPCYNEEQNVDAIYQQVKDVFAGLKNYRYEHIFIDNASTDQTVHRLKLLAKDDNHLKIIVNTRNFGHIRSPFHAILQASGDAVIPIVADLQEPPSMIRDFLQKWEQGFKVVVGIKPATQEKFPMATIRRVYYRLIARIAEIKVIKNFTGFGLYDRSVINALRQMDDPYPYFRGMISEIGFPVAEIPFEQPIRQKGVTKNNFYTHYDLALLGITSHSKLPIRLATLAGFSLSILSFMLAIVFLLLKLFLWYSFPMGIAPILIGMFFFASVQLFFIGILGEYVLSIHTQVLKRPLVTESERINFDSGSAA